MCRTGNGVAMPCPDPQDAQQLQDLAAELSSALAGPPATPAAAVQELTMAQQQYEDLIQQHQGHLLAASCFPTSQVAQALEVSTLDQS